jgi:hypothetical protein
MVNMDISSPSVAGEYRTGLDVMRKEINEWYVQGFIGQHGRPPSCS